MHHLLYALKSLTERFDILPGLKAGDSCRP